MTPGGLAKASFVAALSLALVAVFAPTYTSCGTTADGTSCGSVTAFTVNGWWTLFVVSVPVMVALIPVLVRRRWIMVVAAVLLWFSCVIGAASVGLFFVPAAILMTIATALRDPVPVPTG